MSSGCLRNLIVWTGFHRVNEIRELYGVLDEKHRDVVPDNICKVVSGKFRESLDVVHPIPKLPSSV